MGDVPTLDVSHDETFVAPIGVIFCKVLQGIKNDNLKLLNYFFNVFSEPWQLHLSRSRNQLYFFNYKTNEKLFEPPHDSVSPYL